MSGKIENFKVVPSYKLKFVCSILIYNRNLLLIFHTNLLVFFIDFGG